MSTAATLLAKIQQSQNNPNSLKALRAEADESRKEFFRSTIKSGDMLHDGKLTPTAQAEYDAFSDVIAVCSERLGNHEAMGSFDGKSQERPSHTHLVLVNEGNERPENSGQRLTRGLLQHATAEQREELRALAGYMTGRPMALSNLTPSGDGGVLIPTFVQAAIERNYASFSPVVNNCRLWSTDTGADDVFPVLSDSENAEQVSSAASTGADATVSGDTPPTTLTGPKFKAYKVSSKPVFIPRETFTDTDINLIEEVLGALLARVIRFENARYTHGSGSSQAEGFLTNCIRFETSATVDLDMALDLAYSVSPLYRPRGIYMASDTTIKYLRKLKTGISGDKRQLWAFEDANATLGTPASLHGYPIIVNNDMHDVSPDGSFYGGELAFGDFTRFVVRQAEQNIPWLWNYPVPAKDGRGVILFRRSDSHLLVPEAIAKIAHAGS